MDNVNNGIVVDVKKEENNHKEILHPLLDEFNVAPKEV